MNRILEYGTVSNSPDRLVAEVNRAIALGWEPIGGPVFLADTVLIETGYEGGVLVQAIVRRENH